MPHEHDVVGVRLFLGAGTTARDVAAVVVHAHDWTFVKRTENNIFLGVRHKCYRTTPQRSTKSTKIRIIKMRVIFTVCLTLLLTASSSTAQESGEIRNFLRVNKD